MIKLTEPQQHQLRVLEHWTHPDTQVCSDVLAQRTGDRRTLSALEQVGYVEWVEDRPTVGWRLTATGRQAAAEVGPAPAGTIL
jgi:hypothetical protein